jgi:hypothetical protein
LEPPAVALAHPAAPVVARAARVVRAEKRPAAVRRVKGEQLLIKLETDNPDVVIYWIAEKRGDE